MSQKWIPEIMYEDSEEGGTSNIPFIMVPQNEVMPKLLYVFESRQTDTTEPNHEGEEVPVFEWDLHQYADMAILKNNLSPVEYDNVRFALGLDSLLFASQEGKKITENIRNKVEIGES